MQPQRRHQEIHNYTLLVQYQKSMTTIRTTHRVSKDSKTRVRQDFQGSMGSVQDSARRPMIRTFLFSNRIDHHGSHSIEQGGGEGDGEASLITERTGRTNAKQQMTAPNSEAPKWIHSFLCSFVLSCVPGGFSHWIPGWRTTCNERKVARLCPPRAMSLEFRKGQEETSSPFSSTGPKATLLIWKRCGPWPCKWPCRWPWPALPLPP